MLAPILDSDALSAVAGRVRTVVVRRTDFADAWLALGYIAAAEESALHFDAQQCDRFAGALRRLGIERLLAISTEDLAGEILAFSLASSAEDLAAFSAECTDLNFVLLGVDRIDIAILCTIDDFLLIGGSRSFVMAAIGDPHDAELRFSEFIRSHFEVTRPGLERAAKNFATLGLSS